MPTTSKDMERLILTDGWVPTGNTNTQRKKGKVTIPLSKSTEQSILKQVGLK